MKKAVIIAMTAMLTLGIAACGKKQAAEIPYEPEVTETYENPIEIEGQWGANNATGPAGQYGIGDPFVMRYNGKYYLYPSTSDGHPGIKVFESDDLVHWTYKGYAVSESDPTAVGAYAPEVIYYRGRFYLCQSRAGKGHYIYRSDSPTEGFMLVSKNLAENEPDIDYGNLGMGIDGSFFVTDDGRLLLLHTSTPAGLKYNEILDTDDITSATISETRDISAASLNQWIEGPSVFRRGDYSYLTYTGNHVISRGYRVAYSYAKDMASLSGFTQPADNVTLIDTSDEHYGLGHSSNVNGPDMDSVYTAYHSLVGRGPARRYNLDRYLASGGLLTANGVTHTPVAMPSRPDAEAVSCSELVLRDGAALLSVSSGDYFTAEYNLTPSADQELYFGVTGESRYVISFTANGLTLSLREGGSEKVIARGAAVYDGGRLNTVRVENGAGRGHVYLNSMRVITYEAKAAAGGVGYAVPTGAAYTAVTNDVFGSSDFEAVKNLPTKFPATSYLKGENRGYSIAGAKVKSGGVRVGEKESISEAGDGYSVDLKKNDWVKYAVTGCADTYQIAACVTRASVGAKLRVTLGNVSFDCTVPEAGPGGSEAMKVTLGRASLAESGVTTLKVQVLTGSVGLVSMETYANAADAVYGGAEEFAAVDGKVTASGSTLTVDGTNGTALALWGNGGTANFEATFRISVAYGAAADCGIVFRTKHYSNYPSQPVQSFIGYYLNIGEYLMALNRYNYGGAILDVTGLRGDSGGLFSNGAAHTVTVRAESNLFTVSVDGEVKLTVYDDCAYFDGRVGLYARSAAVTMTEFRYVAL